ncbi:MAG: GDSL-type esterase/lipase family protein [Candidatus Omnitrophica bacterium]|nr:GDSL-type esterase/lipase family protein [Candidatus Omnitrophota bacterium]
MKKNNLYIIFVLILTAGSVLMPACAKREVKNINSTGKIIICFGDSITFGYGVERGEDYPSLLANLLGEEVINAGVDGDTTADALTRIESAVLEKNPRLVIVEFGGNDFLKKIPMEETVSNMKKIITLIQDRGAMAAIADTSAGIFLKSYRAEFSKIAKKSGVIFIPSILEGILTNPSLKSDFLHPNDKGYKMIARKVYLAVKPYLKK